MSWMEDLLVKTTILYFTSQPAMFTIILYLKQCDISICWMEDLLVKTTTRYLLQANKMDFI